MIRRIGLRRTSARAAAAPRTFGNYIRLVVPAVLLCVAASSRASAEDAPVIAAASDLKFALEAVADRFASESGGRVQMVFGSSGTLTRQIMDGAPYDLFLSADEGFVQKLAAAGLTRDRGVLYGAGRIVLFAPHGSPLTVDDRLDGLRALVGRGAVGRFAIANPQHAPYGRAAEAALRLRNLWDAIRPALVLGENVAQAAQFATTGNAVGGILAHSLVLAPPLSNRGTYVLLPESLHAPLLQRMVLLKRAKPEAERFYKYLQKAPARQVLRQYGFTVPGD